jgi:MoxR-like ATPase
MVLAAKAMALLAGRYHVAADDIRRVAMPALNHRIIRNFQAEMDHVTPEAIVEAVLAATRER